MITLKVEFRAVTALKQNPRNVRTHTRKQIEQIARSIREFGFCNPVLVDEDDVLIAGHGRLQAARLLLLDRVPAITMPGLSPLQKRKLMLADNKIAANAGWDRERLAIELHDLIEIDDAGIEVTGFEPPEIDALLVDFDDDESNPEDEVPEPQTDRIVSKRGDLWQLGRHRLLCGDARQWDDVRRLCNSDRPAAAFTDPPYNVKVAGIVGRGRRKHAEFAMASGEMSDDAYRDFLESSLANAARISLDGAVHFVCIDWRHVAALIDVGGKVYDELLNLCVWVKSNAGQGSFYRSQHELIGVFRVGNEAHRNNIELGRHGRNRSNVWHYAGVNTFGKGRLDDLSSHPTVKPVAMVADAIRDCTRRGEIVLDMFAGSGTTLLACEKIGRRGLALEYEPKFVDVIIRRWQAFAGRDAVHLESGKTFDEVTVLEEAE